MGVYGNVSHCENSPLCTPIRESDMTSSKTQSFIRKMSMHFEKDVTPYYLIITLCVFLAYANTFNVPFIFDDQINIVENTSIRNLSSVFEVFAPPFGTGIAGRPVVNFTLALNYAISGENPWSYHLLNLLIHLSATLCFFEVMRMTFQSDRLKGKYGAEATPLAFVCALLWALHPLQTQAVTYAIQRCESLMGLCFLLMFYFAVRGWQSAVPRQWHMAAILSFLVGIGTKEVIVVAPVLLFVYDLLFFHGDPKNAIKRSPLLYTGLLFGLLCLGLLIMAGGTAASGTGRITFSAFDYWITQPEVILHYLKLAVWPYPLSLDYDWPITSLRDSWPAIITVAGLIAVSAWMLWKRLPIGFPAALFFAVLAPTSLIPLPDVAFEHRMYIPSTAVIVIIVTGFYGLTNYAASHWCKTEAAGNILKRRGTVYVLLIIVPVLAIITYARNIDYCSDVSIWTAAARNYPKNSRVQANLGNALMQKGNLRNAVVHLYEALRLETENARRHRGVLTYYEYLSVRPVYAKVQDNIGWLWLEKGNAAEAANHFQEVLKVNPNNAVTLAHMGMALHFLGKRNAALNYFRSAVRLKPSDTDIRVNYGVILRMQGEPMEAIEQFQEVLRLTPGNAEAHYGMGMALRQLGKHAEAIGYFQETLRLNPKNIQVREIMEQLTKKRKTGSPI